MTPTIVQRLENAAIGFVLYGGAIMLGCPWWFPFALFLVFDLSMLGYRHGPIIGARVYNLVHSYIGPCLVGLLVLLTSGAPGWVGWLACSWGFHVATDRALGYGLKHDTGFTHTHLGHLPVGAR